MDRFKFFPELLFYPVFLGAVCLLFSLGTLTFLFLGWICYKNSDGAFIHAVVGIGTLVFSALTGAASWGSGKIAYATIRFYQVFALGTPDTQQAAALRGTGYAIAGYPAGTRNLQLKSANIIVGDDTLAARPKYFSFAARDRFLDSAAQEVIIEGGTAYFRNHQPYLFQAGHVRVWFLDAATDGSLGVPIAELK